MSRKTLLLLFLLAAAIRMIFVLPTGQRTSFPDYQDYVDSARSFCELKPYPETGSLPLFRPPFYPLFLSIVTLCNLDSFLWVKMVQAILSALSVVLIAKISYLVFSDRRAAALAGIIAVFYFPLFFVVKEIQTETLFAFLMLLSTYFLLRERISLGGICLGLAALTRPSTPAFIPFLFIWLGMVYGVTRGVRKGLQLLVFFLLPILPWTIHNYVRFGDFILISDSGGYAFWRDNNDLAWRIMRARNPEEYQKLDYELNVTEGNKHTAAILTQYPSSVRQQERAWYRLGFEYVKEDPVRWILRTAYKAAFFWRLWVNPNVYSLKEVFISAFFFVPVYVLGGLALAFAVSGKIVTSNQTGLPLRMSAWYFVFLLLFIWIVHTIHLPGIRYRAFVADPPLIIFSARLLSRGIVSRYERLFHNVKRTLPAKRSRGG